MKYAIFMWVFLLLNNSHQFSYTSNRAKIVPDKPWSRQALRPTGQGIVILQGVIEGVDQDTLLLLLDVISMKFEVTHEGDPECSRPVEPEISAKHRDLDQS